MPRDLAALMRGDDEPKDKISRDMEKQDHLAEIKPYVQTLTTSDIDSAVKLEDATFPPEERATREKVFVPPSLHFVPLFIKPQHVILFSFHQVQYCCALSKYTICTCLRFFSNYTSESFTGQRLSALTFVKTQLKHARAVGGARTLSVQWPKPVISSC